MPLASLLRQLKGQVIVSVQAEAEEPLGSALALEAMAQSVLQGGATALRLASLPLIQTLRQQYPQLPIIGLTKPDKMPENPAESVYITPTVEAALSVAQAGASIVATDATQRSRPDGTPLVQWLLELRQQAPQAALMADISTLEEGIFAAELGFDLIGTTLAGYTAHTQSRYNANEPDWELLQALIQACPAARIICEGRLWEPAQAQKALALGAYAVVVGSAISRPQLITRRFIAACQP